MPGAHLETTHRRVDRRSALIVAVALLLGLVLGAVVTWWTEDSDVAISETELIRSVPATSVPATGGGAAAAVPDPGPITLAFVGDVNAEFSLADRLTTDPSDFVGPFADVLRGADLTVANLEAALTDRGTPADKQFTFRAPPAILDALRAGGVDVVGAANNHAVDFGPEGLDQTLAVKRAQADGMVIGIGGDEDEAFAPYLADVGGHRVAVIAATQVLDGNLIGAWTATRDHAGVASAKRVDRLVEAVQAARAEADTVVVFLHWGTETETCPNSSQQELAQTLADAGADVIVGSHAHRVQGAGRLGSAFVDYGVGNFLFGAQSAEGSKSGVLLVTVDDRDVQGYEWRPGRIVDRVPQVLTGDEAAAAVADWNGLRACTGLRE